MRFSVAGPWLSLWLRWLVASATGGIVAGIAVNEMPFYRFDPLLWVPLFPGFVALFGLPQLLAIGRCARRIVWWWPPCLAATWIAFAAGTFLLWVSFVLLSSPHDPPSPELNLNLALILAFVQTGIAAMVLVAALIVRSARTETASLRDRLVLLVLFGLTLWGPPPLLWMVALVAPAMAVSTGALPGAIYGALGGVLFGSMTGLALIVLLQEPHQGPPRTHATR